MPMNHIERRASKTDYHVLNIPKSTLLITLVRSFVRSLACSPSSAYLLFISFHALHLYHFLIHLTAHVSHWQLVLLSPIHFGLLNIKPSKLKIEFQFSSQIERALNVAFCSQLLWTAIRYVKIRKTPKEAIGKWKIHSIRFRENGKIWEIDQKMHTILKINHIINVWKIVKWKLHLVCRLCAPLSIDTVNAIPWIVFCLHTYDARKHFHIQLNYLLEFWQLLYQFVLYTIWCTLLFTFSLLCATAIIAQIVSFVFYF